MIQSSSQPFIPQEVQQEDEARLVEAAKDHPEAFAALYDRYAPRIYRYLLSRLGNVAEAQDLTSLTFLHAFEMLPRYRHRQYFSAWLFAIARNKYVDYLRSVKRRPAAISENTRDPRQEDLLQTIIQSERAAALRGLIRGLPEEDQEILRLRFVAELSFAEIAALLKRKEDTVKKTLYRLLDRLQTQLEEEHAAHA